MEQCAVCLSARAEEGSFVALRCGHTFCVGCLKRCAAHDHAQCPTCRTPHLLDPDELKAAFDKFRSLYRSWRVGGVKGCAGEVADVSKSPSKETQQHPKKKLEAQCKESVAFRDYAQPHERQDIVRAHYRDMRSKQTVSFVKRMRGKYSFEDGRSRCEMTVREAFDVLENYVDSSDPDLGLPNIIHALQTAEAIRAAGHPDWLVLTGLVHDMGKIMFLWGTPEDGQQGTAEGPQWALGGDTFVVGCALPSGPERPGLVFPEFSELNPDMRDPRYSSRLGMYEKHCGIDNLLFAYGHDEYLYHMLKANSGKGSQSLPDEALAIVRYHSAYPWHTARIYDHFMRPEDHATLDWVLEFNKFDLYTKDEHNVLDLDQLWPYYQSLIDLYLPGKLKW